MDHERVQFLEMLIADGTYSCYNHATLHKISKKPDKQTHNFQAPLTRSQAWLKLNNISWEKDAWNEF